MYRLLNILNILVLFSISIFFIACNNPKPKVQSSKPEWILNPNYNGKVGAVGVAGRTYDQRVSTQRKLAIQRALDELAMQQGVKVKLKMKKNELVKNDSVSTTTTTKSEYETTNNSSITAHIEDVWQDKITGEIYIWLVLDK